MKSQGASPPGKDDITFATKTKANKMSGGTASIMANFLHEPNAGDDQQLNVAQYFNMAHLAAELDPSE